MFGRYESPYHQRRSQYFVRYHDYITSHAGFPKITTSYPEEGDAMWYICSGNIYSRSNSAYSWSHRGYIGYGVVVSGPTLISQGKRY